MIFYYAKVNMVIIVLRTAFLIFYMKVTLSLVSCISTMYITSVSENIKRIMGKSVTKATILEITKKVSLNRLTRAGIRFSVRLGKWTYSFIID